MKKIVLRIVSIIICTVIATVTVFGYVFGDINCDGVRNNKDIVMLFRILNSKEFKIYDDYDINGDGAVNNKDVVSLFRYINGIIRDKQNDETQPTESETDETGGIDLISLTSPVGRNETATVSIKGKPNTEYTIKVYYSTTASKASGLEKKTSGADGLVSWSWKVGGSTKPGTFKIVISGGGEKIETSFTVN